ncbi:hypothetical protein ACQJBY_061725 [Aegilops geniculata]
MGSKYYFLFGLCSLLVLSGQRTLLPLASARDIPVSAAATLPPSVHVPGKDNAGVVKGKQPNFST